MKLQLTRPIAFFDIESTHVDPIKARIIELGIIRLYPDGHTDSLCMLFNPEEKITPDNTAIHGFTNEMVKDKPLFKNMADEVAEIFKDCDMGTYNGNRYDIPLLDAEFARAGYKFSFQDKEFVDVSILYQLLNPRTLTAAVADYLKKDHAGAHGAIADTQATIDVLEAMIDRHGEDIPVTVKELALKSNKGKKRLDLAGKFAYNNLDIAVFTFGKNKDCPVFKEKDYLKWMFEKGDFSEDTKNVARALFFNELTAIDNALVPPSKPTGFSNGYTNVR